MALIEQVACYQAPGASLISTLLKDWVRIFDQDRLQFVRQQALCRRIASFT
jgi:hypothetical protein